jgi:SAM-dependent methyltransferase
LIPFDQFLAGSLPEPPARVLEVGCGQGELTASLAVAGYDVLGIDPAAPTGNLFRRLRLEDLEESGAPFDAVVARYVLHHIRDLDAGLDRIASLLRPDGLLVLDEFAWDRLDRRTLEWLDAQRRALTTAEGHEPRLTLEQLRSEWEAEHRGLHGYQAMRAALAARFVEDLFEWVPYLHREVGGASTAVLEQALIDAGTIQALGFRYVGTPIRLPE